jgi:hypothetical protein
MNQPTENKRQNCHDNLRETNPIITPPTELVEDVQTCILSG